MKNIKIGKKFAVVFCSVIVCFCIAVLTSILGMNITGNQYTNFYTVDHEAITRALTIRLNVQMAVKNISLATVDSDGQNTNTYINTAQNCLTTAEENLNWFQQEYKGDSSLVDQFREQLNATSDIRTKIFELAGENTDSSNAQAQALLTSEFNPKVNEMAQLMTTFNDNVTAEGNEVYIQSDKAQSFLLVVSIIISIISAAIAIVMAIKLTNAIVKPIREVQKAMEDIEEGNLNINIAYESPDELGDMAGSMRNMAGFLVSVIKDVDYMLSEMGNGNFTVTTTIGEKYVGDYKSLLTSFRKLRDSLNKTLTKINQSSDQVAAGSDQVSSGAQALSQGATEQASSVEELAATINEISSNVVKNADNAKLASDKTETVKSQTEESSRRMSEMLTAMTDINNRSSEIGKIIKAIEDIAFQTNILALNAAVEAARAGAAGKGFAVVADEVRNLAGKSSEASKNTASLIEGTLQAVENGMKIANETAQALGEVVGGVLEVTKTIDDISNASEEQAVSIRQVTQGIDQISSVVQTNSATAEESAAASEELSGQAQILKNLVGQFRLVDDHNEYMSESTTSYSSVNHRKSTYQSTMDGKY